ncbi:hypothetical protein HDU92_004462 [Lobulomyces angularis]|nr:hypothetical protein HDU92_004462 [Lobulomyces angularis]
MFSQFQLSLSQSIDSSNIFNTNNSHFIDEQQKKNFENKLASFKLTKYICTKLELPEFIFDRVISLLGKVQVDKLDAGFSLESILVVIVLFSCKEHSIQKKIEVFKLFKLNILNQSELLDEINNFKKLTKNYFRKSAKVKTVNEIFSRAEKKLEMNSMIKKRTKITANIVLDRNILDGVSKIEIVAASLYFNTLRLKSTITLAEIAKVYNIPPTSLELTYKLLHSHRRELLYGLVGINKQTI